MGTAKQEDGTLVARWPLSQLYEPTSFNWNVRLTYIANAQVYADTCDGGQARL